MSDVQQVTAVLRIKHAPAERSPARDFAHELAKADTGKRWDGMPPHDIPAVAPIAPAALAPREPAARPDTTRACPGIPMSAAPDAAVLEQLSVAIQPTGITEALLGSRVYGVHLLASAYLSELVARGEPWPEAVPEVTLPAIANTSSQPYAAIPGVPHGLSGANQDASPHEDGVTEPSLLVKSELAEPTSPVRSTDGVSLAMAEASTMPWPESSLRLTRQHDGSAVIWLRDYRLPDDEASRVADALAEGAKAAGIRLGRIVLNGREVWTSSVNH